MATPTGDLPPAAAMRSPEGNGATEYWTSAGTVRGPLSRREAEAAAEHEQASVAEATAFGLATLASATFTLSTVFAGWFRPVGIVVAIPVLLVVGGIAQFLAGMWAHRRGEVLTAAAFSILGSFYAAFAVVLLLVATRLVAAATVSETVRGVTGIFVLTIALLAAGLGVAALGKNHLLAAMFFLLAIAYVCDGLGIWTQPPTWFIAIGFPTFVGAVRSGWLLTVGRYAGLIAALLGFYGAIALIVNSASARGRWPIFNARSRPTPPRPTAQRPPAQRPAAAES